jgi:cytosine/adenosine deaminase-related metal-dependent hydrolase
MDHGSGRTANIKCLGMTYRKFKADYLFTGRELATGDPFPIEDPVLVTSEEGTVQAIIPLSDAGEDVLQLPGLLSPGFVNCHCHLELSHMKGALPENTGLVDFLLGVIRQRNPMPGGSPETGEHIRSCIEAAEQEMLAGGIVAVGDICNTTDTLSQKMTGHLFYHNFIETIGFLPSGASDRFDNSRKIFNAFAESYTLPIGANSIVPHAPYSVSSDLFRLVAGFPGNHVLTIHNQESEAENVFYRSGQGDFLRLYQAMGLDVSFFQGTGKRSLESFLPHFHHNQTLILVHNVATGEEDLQFAMNGRGTAKSQKPDLFFCLCPCANLYISGRLPDVDALLRHDCTMVVGTDSLASNHQLSILEEIKVLQRAYPQLSTPLLLQWSTYNGACALQLDSVLGSFQPGKKPGVLLIDNLDGVQLTDRSGVRRLI